MQTRLDTYFPTTFARSAGRLRVHSIRSSWLTAQNTTATAGRLRDRRGSPGAALVRRCPASAPNCAADLAK